MTIFESVIIYSTFFILIGYLIFRKVKEMWNTVTMAKAYHLNNTKLPTQAQVNRALEAFKKSYQKKLKNNKMDKEENKDKIDENDPSYGEGMYQ